MSLRFRAAQTQHGIGQGPHSAWRDRIATDITLAVAAVIELGYRALCPCQHALERISNADVGQSAHRLGGAIADPFAEPNRATTFRTAGERGQTLAGGVTTSL